MKVVVFLIIILHFLEVVDSSCSWTTGSWSSWSTCTKTCGGGTSKRVRKCFFSGQKTQTKSCNTICYHGGQYKNGNCQCSAWRTGECCQDCRHIYIAHCKSGKQTCGGSPDNIKCTECSLPYISEGYGQGCRRRSCQELNGGCEHTCLVVTGKATCSCKNGYRLSSNGASCTDINECSTGVAKCNHHCLNTPGSFQCSCRNGYKLDSDGYTCTDIDECVTGEAKCEQQCINLHGAFKCDCNPGFILQNATKCVDIDECTTNNGGCSHNCVNDDGSHHCTCNSGYILDTDEKSCNDIDECRIRTDKCSQQCSNAQGSYTCSCDAGYVLQSDGHSCKDIDDCIGVDCMNGGSCIDNLQSYVCKCERGFTGIYCENDINECEGFLKGGCEEICINTVGSFKCSCHQNKTLESNGLSCSGEGQKDSVLPQLLPRGCSTIVLTRCTEGSTVDILLSSTSPWYRLDSNYSVVFSYGIIFVELNSLALPISLTGIQISSTGDAFSFKSGSISFSADDGTKIGEERTYECASLNLTSRDVIELIESQSLLTTFFSNLIDFLPDWLTFSSHGTDNLGVRDLSTDLIRGRDLFRIPECKGAPVDDNRLYTVLKFGGNFSMSLYGKDILLPKPVANHEFCILIDICQDKGGSLFIMIPEESRSFIDDVDIFDNLKSKYGLVFRPIGLGLSLFRHINVISQTTAVKMWNGDRLFTYQVTPEANFWMAGTIAMTLGDTFQLHLDSQASLFASVPRVPNLLQSLFLEEWNILFRMNLIGSIGLKFVLLGKEHNIHLDTVKNSELTAYASVGGQITRKWCGETANPPGFYLSLMVNINPFLDVPILRYLGIDLNSDVYAFLAPNPNLVQVSENRIDIFEDILNLKETIGYFVNTTLKYVSRYANLLRNESLLLLKEVDQAANDFERATHVLINGTDNALENIELFVNRLSFIWSSGWKTLEKSVFAFKDSVVNITDVAKQAFITVFDKSMEQIQKKLGNVLKKFTDQLMSLYRNVEGFGLRFKATLSIFNIKIAGLEVEFVYSVDQLGSCSRLAQVYKLLEGERAARIYGVVSVRQKIAPFLSVFAGGGVGIAISVDHLDKFHFQIHSEASLLGIKAQTDVIISSQGYFYSIEGSVWNTFKARLTVSFYPQGFGPIGTINVKGTFLANADDGSTFQDSYLGALQKLTSKIADEADKRISQAQNALTQAQNALTKAQNWLDEKKYAVRQANVVFDKAVAALERAKDKVEEAKKPFENAIGAINEAQRKVDRLCTIKSCRNVCIAGLKCVTKWKKVGFIKIRYPSCRWTNCMISFPDPICVAFNLGCRAVRGIAYLALEAAKLAVRIPMLALDAAKLALSGAQFVVDKSRVVLVIAEGALDLANLGLEGAKGLFEGAKAALEGIKLVVGWGIKALNFILEYGIGSIIDIRNCGFVLTTIIESTVFQVQCEINMFRTGFRKINIGINFGNYRQSIWQASKKSLDAFMDETKLGDRRKREIKYMATKSINQFIRDTRNAHIEENKFDDYLNATLETISRTPGFEGKNTPSDYENRVQHFKAKCSLFKISHDFFDEATQLLLEMSEEAADVLTNATDLTDDLSGFNIDEITQNFSIEKIGIDPDVGANEFNLSTDAISEAVMEAKENLTNDPFLQDIDNLTKESKSMLQSQYADVNNIKIINNWIVGMNDVSEEYFDDDKCISFMDCAHYVINELYGLFDAENIPNMEESIDTISNFEDLLLDLTANNSHTIIEVRNFTEQLTELLETLESLNMFCSQAPHVVQEMKDQTVVKGRTLNIECGISGNPIPSVWWYRDDEYLSDYDGSVLTIHNVSNDDSRRYRCVAGNIVANLSSETVEVIVLDEEPLRPPLQNGSEPTIQETRAQESDSHITVILSVTMSLLGTIIAVVIIVVFRYYTRRKARKEDTSISASTVSIKSWMTSNMVAPDVRKPVFATRMLRQSPDK